MRQWVENIFTAKTSFWYTIDDLLKIPEIGDVSANSFISYFNDKNNLVVEPSNLATIAT